MTDSNIIHAEIREDVGKGASRRLRHQGKIPAVLYGGDKAPVTLTLEHNPLMHASEVESFFSTILEIQVADGRKQKVVVRDISYHPYRQQIMHFDFMRVSEDEQLRMFVPIHYENVETSPAERAPGVVIQYLVNEVEISALPANLPEALVIDMSQFDSGDFVMLSDIKLPEGVVILALASEDGEDAMIANTVMVKESQGTGEAAAEEAAEAELEAAGELDAEDAEGASDDGGDGAEADKD